MCQIFSPRWACPRRVLLHRSRRALAPALAAGRHAARGREERARQSPMPDGGETPAPRSRASWKAFIAAGVVSTWQSERCPCCRLPAPAQSLVARCEPSEGEIGPQNPPVVDLGLLRGAPCLRGFIFPPIPSACRWMRAICPGLPATAKLEPGPPCTDPVALAAEPVSSCCFSQPWGFFLSVLPRLMMPRLGRTRPPGNTRLAPDARQAGCPVSLR